MSALSEQHQAYRDAHRRLYGDAYKPAIKLLPCIVIKPAVVHLEDLCAEQKALLRRLTAVRAQIAKLRDVAISEIDNPEPGRISGSEVIEATVKVTGVTVDRITGPGRWRTETIARRAATIVMRKHCPHLTSTTIGRLLGGRDHATILYSLKQATAYPQTAVLVVEIEQRLGVT